jgi:uncharacterized protein
MEEEFFDRLREKILPYFKSGDGHDFGHVDRVYRLVLKISEEEDVDMDVVRAAALLHDVARSERGGDGLCHAERGARMALGLLKEIGFPKEKFDAVAHAIEVHQYSRGLKAESREAEILQDADRLDALGAVIIVRMVEAATKYKEPIYDPNIPIKDEYDGSKLTLINHIYEKLLKMTPDSFKTEKAREIAKGRYDFVKEFAERYVGEVEGKI